MNTCLKKSLASKAFLKMFFFFIGFSLNKVLSRDTISPV